MRSEQLGALLIGAVSLAGFTSCTSVYFASTDACVRDRGFACEVSADLTADAGPSVASVFLIGDAGEPDPLPPAAPVRDLILDSLHAEVQATRQAGIETRLVFLGDNIYPDGLRDATDQGECAGSLYCPEDQAQLDAQIRAIPDGVEAYFLAGNHDWGNTSGKDAYLRILNQGTYLGARGQELVPAAGCPGPVVRDLVVGNQSRLRMIFLDTQWLLLPEESRPGRDSEPSVTCTFSAEEEVYERLGRDLASADVPVLLLLHHPIRTYGDHGGSGSWRSRLLYRAGWSAQDVNSAPYARMITRLDRLLEEAGADATRRIVVAAGHEHALQVIYDAETTVHHLISGSGSKVSRLQTGPGSEFAAGFPGYMRLDIHEEGSITLVVRAACPSKDGEPLGTVLEHDGGITCTVGDFATAFAKALN